MKIIGIIQLHVYQNLTELKRKASTPIITKTANADDILSGNQLDLFKKHLVSAELYRLLSQLNSGRPQKNEFTNSIIIV